MLKIFCHFTEGKKCGGQDCHDEADCIDDKCKCGDGLFGDGVTYCESQY